MQIKKEKKTSVPWLGAYERSAFLFSSPFILFFALTILIPVVVSFAFSFMRIGYTLEFVGLQNYIDIFRDPLFFQSYYNIFIIMVGSIPVTMLLALFFAVLLNAPKVKGKGFFRTVYYIPTVTSTVAVASVFMTFFNPTGIFNGFLNLIGLDSVQWLSDPFWIRVSMIVTTVWMSIGYNTILFLAGLQGISKEVYESAEIDGASKFRQFFNLTVPMLKPVILMATVLATINGLGSFNVPNIFFGTSNGPDNSAIVVGVQLYKTSFEMVNFGKASAIAWTMVLVSGVFSAIQFKLGGNANE
ncbi:MULTISPECIES: carbohydrate ABC transporter permease [Enterococcus]|uniref:Sugar ABC transporter permease n=1 Tax=Enterococcus casseliflavus TaxID=37734 RepID=A0A415EPR5_ENTCA|nr:MULTISPECIES: sugar ABC transporter permease [Enterococcus]MUN74209.1 ABC transporter permease subunit [Enterococcus casseliflavus]MUN97158.1 ABC transporter permease subunit [Enterococcus casseliflavus]RHK05228.1 sugar ABC transporter permease [Enterococcus casseliflavus]